MLFLESNSDESTSRWSWNNNTSCGVLLLSFAAQAVQVRESDDWLVFFERGDETSACLGSFARASVAAAAGGEVEAPAVVVNHRTEGLQVR